MLRAMLAWHLGLRYLRRRRTAWLALAAITLTVAVPVVVLGVMQGFIDITRLQVRANESDLTIEAPWQSGPLVQDAEDLATVTGTTGVANVAPFVATYAILTPREGGADLRLNLPCMVDAIDWQRDEAMGRLTPAVLHPRPVINLHAAPLAPDERGSGMLTPAWRDHLALTGMELVGGLGIGPLPLPPRLRPHPGMVIGRELAYSKGLRPGWTVRLTVPNGSGGTTGQITAQISDTIGTGIYSVDSMAGLLPLPLGQRLADLHARGARPAGLSGYRVQLTPGADPETVRRQLIERTGQQVVTWMERGSSNLIKSFEIQRNIMGLVMVLIQGIAVFIVYAVFSTLVAEKRHDIGVLLGLGARRSDISNTFLLAGIVACVAGGALGWMIGWGCLLVLNPLSNLFGIPLFPQDVLYTPDAPISWNPLIPLFFVGVMTLVGLLAVLLPAIRASRIDPIATLREGG
ncbi:MAG: ABC transporter permease [Planctomycetes bacterium]|jgi:ABC-type lipoprotein release transport system permease subunit|nr:ABC transporter permease [Planctomycetota bacterium]